MIEKHYKATNGYHDDMPGQTIQNYTAVYTEDGQMIGGPSGPQRIGYNEIQIGGDSDYRRSLMREGDDMSRILFLDDPDYDALFIRRQTFAGKQIPMDHDLDFVARWVCLSLMSEEVIQRGLSAPYLCFNTIRGNWGGIATLSLKRQMIPYIEGMDNVLREELIGADSSREFANKFIDWRNGMSGRMRYQSIEQNSGGE